MSKAPIEPRVLRSLAAALCYAFVVGIGFSLSLPLLAFALEQAGANRTMVGFNSGMAGLGTIAMTPLIAPLAQRLGVERTLYLGLVVTALCLVSFTVIAPIWPWFPLRFLLGASLGVLFVVSEFWINATAPQDRLSLVLGIYATALSIGFAAGPQVLRIIGHEGNMPFYAGAVVVLTAIIPLWLVHGDAPKIEAHEKSQSVSTILFAVPMATLAALVYGAIETGAFALLPLYGTSLGRSVVDAASMISMVALGNLLFAVPLGLLADRVSRKKVLIGLAFVGLSGSLLAIRVAPQPLLLDSLLFIWGGMIGGFYTVGLALLGEKFEGVDLANANAVFVMMYSVGAMAFPLLYGAAMDIYNPHGLMLAFAATFALYLSVPLLRMKR